MQSRRGNDHRLLPSEPALRVIMRRLRDIMAGNGDGQSRLDDIVRQIAGVMVAEVCSIYLRRRDGSLELFATEGLKREAVHKTRLSRGEGLVGRCAELAVTVNEPDAASHPSFSYRPETGEEEYHSLLAVPIQRAGQVIGVLVVQNHTKKEYSEEDIEVLQSTAMLIAELLVSGAVAGSEAAADFDRQIGGVVRGEAISDGIALGHVVLHEPRVVVTTLLAEDPAAELARVETALDRLRAVVDEMFAHERLSAAGEHRDVLEAYRMFAHDRGWHRRLFEAVQAGLTAEAAVERVQNTMRSRMLRQSDHYWRERMRDLNDLSDRLLRILAGAGETAGVHQDLPPDTILVARTMGPAELLDYDRTRLRGLIVEDGSSQSHVAIVAKALGIAAIGQAGRIVERVSSGDAVIVDAEAGEVHIRPPADVVSAYADKVRFRAKRQQRYAELRAEPAVTRDRVRIELGMNAGLLVDMSHLEPSGADGVGLFRTELQFMLSDTLPRLDSQTAAYRAVLAEAQGRPVVFRTLDIGGDKVLPYLRAPAEENPAMGWRAVRMSLDRPALFRTQVRALMRASDGGRLDMMVPMVTDSSEIDALRAIINKEIAHAIRHGYPVPAPMRIGAMFEVPSLLFELDRLLPRVDFLSIGSNDLLQFLFAADRTNAQVASRFDPLSHAPLRALRRVFAACDEARVPVTVCGEMAGDPITAMALIGLGCRSLSMSASAIGPVKTMVLSIDKARLDALLQALLEDSGSSVRAGLVSFAEAEGVEL
ncbi:MAG: phosphoenolpyruvate--protein phosphotransferase [Hyphomicrobiaceae bacterium]|nr:phosphoenolpyruvate--protein phosphotransferase [Hyphomicrobiaceae bacterium]